MIIKEENLKRIRDFVLEPATDEQLKICDDCCDIKKNKNCADKDLCNKYSAMHTDDRADKLIADLFDTIDFMQKQLKS